MTLYQKKAAVAWIMAMLVLTMMQNMAKGRRLHETAINEAALEGIIGSFSKRPSSEGSMLGPERRAVVSSEYQAYLDRLHLLRIEQGLVENTEQKTEKKQEHIMQEDSGKRIGNPETTALQDDNH
jgi:hypothetical protein